MIGKVKKWLGIEGVKVELVLPENAFKELEAVSGSIRFYSKNEQAVTSVKLTLIEKYTRGRGKEKRINEYSIGEEYMEQRIEVPAEGVVEVEFTLPFKLVKSEMDEFQEKNILTGGIARLAKKISNVQSEYYILAEAKVEGTALDPFDKQELNLR